MCSITDEIFNFLDSLQKLTGTAYWACRACTAYAQGMDHWLKDIENKLEEVKQFCTKMRVR